ncbi:MAG: serine hydrolase domain-containing protein [Bacteroidota bacterium]
MKHLAGIWVLLLAWNQVALGQTPSIELTNPETVGMSSDSLQQMNRHFHQLVDEYQLAGIQTAVMRKGKLIHFDSYGYANIAEEKELDEASIFRIFSMTKPIVSVGLMQLYEQGKFDLEDPLHKFLPEYNQMQVFTDSGLVPVIQPIRIIASLRHTSGFTYGRSQYPELDQLYAQANVHTSATNKEFVTQLSQFPLLFEPGTDWQYGFSTNICGYLIEVLSGKPLDEYLQEHILEPLQMKDTHFQVPEEKVGRFTVGYGWQEEGGLSIVENQRDNRYVNEVTLFNGGGGLVSTTMDYLKFCQMMLNRGEANGNRILTGETVDLMLKDHLEEARDQQERLRLPPGEYGFGLGFAVRGTGPNDLERVFGWGGAVGTYFKIDIEHELVYVLMIQLSPYRQLRLRELFQQYVEAAIIG